MFHQSRNTARAAMGATGLLVLLFLFAAFGSASPALAASPYYAGYVATTPGTYTGAQVTFTVPSFQQPTGGPKVAYAAEVSVKGGTFDAGIYSYLDPSGNQINKAYWEFYGNGSVLGKTEDLSLGGGNGGGVVSPGDRINAFLNLGSNGASFSVYDETTKDSGSYTLSGNNYPLDGVGAGCIVLVPLADLQHPQPPADFGTLNVQHCQVSNTPVGISTINAFQNVPVDMVNGSFGASTSPDLGNNGDFSVTWKNS